MLEAERIVWQQRFVYRTHDALFALLGQEADPTQFVRDVKAHQDDGLEIATEIALNRQIWLGYETIIGYRAGD